MNPRRLYMLGLILSLAPFSIQVRGYVFLYATLGFGLILIIYLLNHVEILQQFIILSLILILVAAFLNSYEWYQLFRYCFYLLVLTEQLSQSNHHSIVEIISIILMAGLPLFVFAYLASWLGLIFLLPAVQIGWFLYSVGLCVIIIANREWGIEFS